MHYRSTAALFVVAGLVWPTALLPLAAETVAAEETAAAAPAPAPGVMIYVDPETGNLASERPQGVPALPMKPARRSALETYSLPGGGTAIRLGDAFMHATIVEKKDDGTLETHCDRDPAGGVER